ncbi:hypothetical protein [Catellicoccus marimammalium]|uniref:hypothetical protein n=1 Tax=Catellicoccus marimammalium TaxID=300419 RepID=UPI00058F532D|nr:hypothetical protein [Catellicoccus marimammalium]
MVIFIVLLCVVLIALYFWVNVYFDGAFSLVFYFIHDWIKCGSIKKAKIMSKKRVTDYRKNRKDFWK